MIRLRVENLTKRFGGLDAVDAVSFDVARDGVTAVIGPNGAGKTTLFNMISGTFAPTSGRVLFEGGDITGLPPEKVAGRGLIRTFQLVQLFQNLSVHENIKVGRHLHTRGGLFAALVRPGWARREEAAVDQLAHELLAFVGLTGRGEISASMLPYGQQRLLEIARALAAEPKLLLLDEPAAGLNADETRRLSGVIRRIADHGTSVLLIEHDMALVMNTADTVIVLDFGRKIASGAPEAVRNDPAVIEAYLGGVEALHA
jgi:branched-chain amino acid transport system ATP-binding protein